MISMRSIVLRIEYTENAPFSNRDSSSARQQHGGNSFFLVLIERATLRIRGVFY